ncbi:MAG: diguanylate cyclase [Planctomycetota bacterium]
MLAIRDLQRRLWRVLREMPVGEDEVVRILQLDPLSVVRGLRAANAPVLRSENMPLTVRGMAQAIGPALSRRLLDVPVAGVAGTSDVHRLWMHAIATGFAAQELAAASGLMDPDEAYLLGLLHDLPKWLTLLHRQFRLTACDIAASEWIAHWQLPERLVRVLDAVQQLRAGASTTPMHDAPTLICAAELLAELADFLHPDSEDSADGATLAAVDKADLVAAQRLRRQVERALRTFGLDPNLPDPEMDGDSTMALFGGMHLGGLDEVVLNILGCTRSETYRGIITALTAAAVRYGGYDRAFYCKWDNANATMIVRTKADSSARRVTKLALSATADEAAALRAALLEERAVRVQAQLGRRDGILAALSADELLAVPLNRAFVVPAFLLLDRSLLMLPIQPDRDSPMATTLGMTGSLLNENLLLRRRRQRAQKFALTDSLTRLFNRRMGLVALAQELARAERSLRPLTMLMCDLDHFKQLNDTHGHLQGDAALRATADVLRQTLRKSDTVCRYGGEEFLVVLPDTAPDDATVMATRLFTGVQVKGQELGLPMTISIGLTALRPGDTAESIMHRADRALYASKDFGRNRFSADIEGVDDAPVGSIP